MCGICGFYGLDDKSLLRDMCSTITYRGPDDQGFFTDNKLGLGHRRLTIIDLSKHGKQPMHNEDRNLWIVYNGEVYNFKEIREALEKKGHGFYSNTDTEVVLHAYEEYGENCLQKFNGMFAFAIWDSNKKQLFLARDRIGIKPLYYAFFNDVFLFASEMKSILQYKEIGKEINYNALNNFLTFRYVPGNETILKHIKKLLPGHYLIFKKNDIKIKKYWDLFFSPKNKSSKFFSAQLRKLMDNSVKLRLISDVPLGALLSGGLDSSTIVALMSSYQRPKTFTIGFSNEPENEFKYAKKIADTFNTDHHAVVIEPESFKVLPKIVYYQDEPLGGPTSIAHYLIYEEARKHVKVLLIGDGADELFAGYEQHKIMALSKKYNRLVPKFIQKNLVLNLIKLLPNEIEFKKLSSYLANLDSTPRTYIELISSFDHLEKKLLYSDYLLKRININSDIIAVLKYFKNSLNCMDQTMLSEIKTWLPNDILHRCDRMTMAHSLEGRFPFLDYRIAELSATMPSNLKLKKKTEKYILREAMKDLLPKQILKRKKQRFSIPIEHWFGKEYENMVANILLEDNELNRKFFNKNYLSELLNYKKRYSYRLFLKHYTLAKRHYANKVWNLLALELWYKIFIEEVNYKKIVL